MKTISIVIPTYNEEENIIQMCEAIKELFLQDCLNKYNLEILIIDNCSTDHTRELINKLCEEDKEHVRAIYNIRNFGPANSTFYGVVQSTGDCAILLSADFQEPIEMIPIFVKEWENGYKIVAGQKNVSDENKIKYFLRQRYYKLIRKMSDVNLIEQFDAFGLYDRQFLDLIKTIKDPCPWLRGLVAEYGYKIKIVPYKQNKRIRGHSKVSWYLLYNDAMLSFTTYTKIGLRFAVFLGTIVGLLSFLVGIIFLILKLLKWNSYSTGIAPLLIGIFFIGSIQLFFLGLVGEYILTMNTRLMDRPIIIEEKRINFDNTK